jgi:hypothetical protein
VSEKIIVKDELSLNSELGDGLTLKEINEYVTAHELYKIYDSISIEGYSGYDGDAGVSVFGHRLETDHEFKMRLDRDLNWKKNREAMDRKKYEELKAKFES